MIINIVVLSDNVKDSEVSRCRGRKQEGRGSNGGSGVGAEGTSYILHLQSIPRPEYKVEFTVYGKDLELCCSLSLSLSPPPFI